KIMAIADLSNVPLAEIVSLKGRRTAVTGSAHGIGAAIAKRLAEAGAVVVIGDLDDAGAVETARAIAGATGASVQAFALDVQSEESITSFADAAMAAMGGLDI